MAIQDITGVTNFLGCLVQRSTIQFGLGSSPTTVDLDLIQDPPNGFIFNVSGAKPGNLHRFQWGAVDFGGIVQSWNKQSGPDGEVFNVKLVDPRIVFNTLPIITDQFVPNPSGLNLFNILDHYGTPQKAELTPEGMPFRKIRDDIQNSGRLYLYGNYYVVQFTGGFSDSKIPAWYRPNFTKTDLGSLCSRVSEDFGMDFYSYIEPSTLAGTGNKTIVLKTIDRTQALPGTVSGVIASWQASGIVQRYTLGAELRTDPTASLVLGTNFTRWDAPISAEGKTTKTYWGRSQDGSALFHFNVPAGGYYPDDTTREASNFGIVRLDHIGGSYAATKLNHDVARITYEKITIQRNANAVNPYPPQITRTVTTATTTGYYPSNNIMRAALFSQEAFEALLFNENFIFASSVLGIYASPFLVSTSFTSVPNITIPLISSGSVVNYSKDNKYNKNLVTVGANHVNRTEDSLALANAVYEATRQAADTYFGKSWIVDLPSSTFLKTGSYSSTDLVPSIEYQTAPNAWAASGFSSPSGIGNHSSLFYSTNPQFREDNGNIKPFVSFDNFDNTSNSLFYMDNVGLGLPFNMSTLEDQAFIVDQGGNIVLPISTEQYELDPDRAVVTIASTIEGQLPVVGLSSAQPYIFPPGFERFGHFLLALDFTPEDITKYKLLRHADESKEFGIANPRIYSITSDGTSQGFFIPLEYKYQSWGPFFSVSGIRNGGTNVITDGSLSPTLYGSYSNFAQAATDTANLSVANATDIESGDFTLVGLPLYNIGDPVGPNNIISLSTQIGINGGITTNYSLRSFALPSIRVSKLLQVGKKESTFIQQNIENINKLLLGDNTIDVFKNKLGHAFKGFTPYGSLLWNGPGVASFNCLISELSNGN